MIGSGYSNLLSTESVLFCKMLFAQSLSLQSVLLKATILSDNIIECEINEYQDQYLKGVKQQVTFTLSL